MINKEELRIVVSTNNKKMNNIPSVSIYTPEICQTLPCWPYCYVKNHMLRRKNVKASYINNKMVWDIAPNVFENQLNAWLTFNRPLFFRWHVGGEIPSIEYLKMILRVGKYNPLVNFLLFTKRFDLIAMINKNDIPDNLSIVLSNWVGHEVPDFLKKDYAICNVIEHEEKTPEDSILCPGNCITCGACWGLAKRHINVAMYKH